MFLPERDDANVSQETKKEIIFMQKKFFFIRKVFMIFTICT